jgi:phage-related minor tail protein
MTNNTMKTLTSLGSSLMTSKVVQAVTGFRRGDVLDWVGLTRRRSHFWENLALVGVGAVVGATGALLFAPAAGRETRRRIGKQATRIGEQAGERFGRARQQSDAGEQRLLDEASEPLPPKAGPKQAAPVGLNRTPRGAV